MSLSHVAVFFQRGGEVCTHFVRLNLNHGKLNILSSCNFIALVADMMEIIKM